jgi:hypothetical protein
MQEDATPRIVFYTDEDVNGPAIRIARDLGVEIVTANEARMRSADDPDHFAYAVERGYVLVTGNITDFAPMFRDWLAGGQDHPGIVYIYPHHRKNSRLIARELRTLYEAGMPDDMKNQTWWI